MQNLFHTGFRPLQTQTRSYLAQANVAVPPITTPPSVPVQPPATVTVSPVLPSATAVAPGIPTIVWVGTAALLIGAIALFSSQASKSSRRR